MAEVLAIALVGAGAVATHTFAKRHLQRESVAENRQLQRLENDRRGTMISATSAQQTVWAPRANTSMEQPRQDLRPGQVKEAKDSNADDIAKFQEQEIQYNFRTRVTRKPIQNFAYTPLLIKAFGGSLPVRSGNTILDNPYNFSENKRRPTAKTIARITGYSDEIDNRGRSKDIKSYLTERRNPFAKGGTFVQITSDAHKRKPKYHHPYFNPNSHVKPRHFQNPITIKKS